MIQTLYTLALFLFLAACSPQSSDQNAMPTGSNLRMPFVAVDGEGKLVRNWEASLELWEQRGLLRGGDTRINLSQKVDSVLWVDVGNSMITTLRGDKSGYVGEYAKIALPELIRLANMQSDSTKRLVADFAGTPFQLIMLKKPRASLKMWLADLNEFRLDYWKITDSAGWCHGRINPKYNLCKTYKIDSISGHGQEEFRVCTDSLVLRWKPTPDTVYVEAPKGYKAVHATSVYPYHEFYVFPRGLPRQKIAFQGTWAYGSQGGGGRTNGFWFVSDTKDEYFRVRWAIGTEVKGSMKFRCTSTGPTGLPAYGVDTLSFQMEGWKMENFTGTTALYTRRQLKGNYQPVDCLRSEDNSILYDCHIISADRALKEAKQVGYDFPEYHGPDSAKYMPQGWKPNP